MTQAARIDLYATIHKALRALMAELVSAVGRMDPGDDADVNATLGRALEGLALCEKHMLVEDQVLHPAIESRQPGATARAALEHAGHVADFAALRAAISGFLAAGTAGRHAGAHALYLQAARWMAENFLHMEHEERHHNGALWASFSDAELQGIHATILATVPPEAMPKYLRWLVPSTSHGERVAQLGGMRESAPREAYEGALALARSNLTARDWDKLARALGALPAAA